MSSLAQTAPAWTTTRAQLARKVGAEAIGTFTIVFAGCGAVAADAALGGTIGHVGVSLTFGLAVMVMVYAVGHISGAHFNPAVTLAFATVGRFPWRQVPAYVVGQLAAALFAAELLALVWSPQARLGVTQRAEMIGVPSALLLECVFTFVLMFVIVAVATDGRAVGQLAGAAIGGTVALCSLFGGPATGASMNPARSFGPAVASGEVGELWLYFAAPIVGAALAVQAYRLLRCEDDEPGTAGGCC